MKCRLTICGLSLAVALVVCVMAPHTCHAASVDSAGVWSASMGRTVPVTVIAPDADKSHPTVYLLHGYGGNHNTWLLKTCPALPSLADSLGIIFVCPDGRNSWYIDSPVDTVSCYETFITHELVAFVDSAYATIPHRHARAICGYSMGGHGALWCSLRHSGVWRAAYCISGCVDLTAYPGRWEIDRVLGAYAGHQAQWRAHSVVNLDAADAGVDISLDCGSEDVFVNDNRRLHRRLSALGVPHRYTEMPGGHTHDYWRAALMRALDYLSPLLQRED